MYQMLRLHATLLLPRRETPSLAHPRTRNHLHSRYFSRVERRVPDNCESSESEFLLYIQSHKVIGSNARRADGEHYMKWTKAPHCER